MHSSILIKEISIETETLRLLIHQNTPMVEYDNETFNHLWLLVEELPLLSDPAYLSAFAEISNFLWKGITFHCIEDIDDFQKRYKEQVILENNHPADVFPYRLTDYKIFDVSVMHPPLLMGGNLIYFVYNTANGLPYRVTCPFPYISTSTLVHYQILPIKVDVDEESLPF